jgi:hypothetical protein
MEVTELRDKVYALLGVAKDCPVVADYSKTPSEILQRGFASRA